MDKTMMFVRRFLRQSLKQIANADWEEVLLEAFVEVVRKEVVLTDPANASLGFQLHFTDVFLEEVAKVGGEDLPAKVVGKLVQPWVELVATSVDSRLIEHTEERIFNHLLRQSDPGIKYQMEEDGMDLEEDDAHETNGAHNGSSENGHENGDGGSEDEENNLEEGDVEDPRAGRVSVVIPQIAVDYKGIAEELFQLGSKEGMRKSNRDMLYRVSKKFKDVSANIFPLGPNLEELEAVEIPKISVKKSAAELAKRQEQIRKENLESKKRAKRPQPKEDEEVVETNGEANCAGDASDEESEQETLEPEESNEGEKEPTEPKVKRENQKKRKQERKRKKREAQLRAALDKAEQEKKLENQLGHDLEINSTLAKKNVDGKDKKRKHDAPLSNGHSTPVKKAKTGNTESNVSAAEEAQGIDINQNMPQLEKKKKKKKNKQNSETSDGTPADTKKGLELGELDGGGKMQEQKIIDEGTTAAKVTGSESALTNGHLEGAGQAPDEEKKLKKKKKNAKKEMHRIDSDISFNAPSLSQTNLSLASKETAAPAPMTPILESETPPSSSKTQK